MNEPPSPAPLPTSNEAGESGERGGGPSHRSAPIMVRGADLSYDQLPVLRQVDLDVSAGTIVSLLGPSGCGKTTLLRAIAGLEHLTTGQISLGDRIVSSARTHVAPEQRRIGMVFQDWALFPHLSVRKNVAYGLERSQRKGARADEVLDMVGLGGLGDRAPHTLSGGQQQRVALARALAPKPSVLLLDEPFSNLDTSLRVEVRTEVHRLLAELDVTTVFVTHDQDEAFVLGQSVAVMDAGEVIQQGSPAELYAHPLTPWVATFVGQANLVPASGEGAVAQTRLGPIQLASSANGPLEVLVRPEHVELVAHESGNGTVGLVEYYGHDTTYEVHLADGPPVRVRLGSAPRFQRGARVMVRYSGGPAVAYPDADG